MVEWSVSSRFLLPITLEQAIRKVITFSKKFWHFNSPNLARGSEWGYLDNTKHFIFGLCNMKKNCLFETVTAPKRPILFCLVYQRVFGHFTTIPDYFRRFPKVPEDSRRLSKISETNEGFRRLPKMSGERSKHSTLFSLETGNVKKLANLTANSENYGK